MMSFELDEAPKIALNYLTAEKVKRGCGMFWTILCIIPTFGTSTIGICDDGNSNSNYKGCCFPRSLTMQTEGALASLIAALEDLKAKDLKEEDEKQFIKDQVAQTLAVLKQTIDDNNIQGSYRDPLVNVYNLLSTRATTDAHFSAAVEKVVNNEMTPLISTN